MLTYIFLLGKKIKIITSDYSVANSIAFDDLLNIKFATFIPSKLCEVKGVCPIPLGYPESEIFEFGVPKNMSMYGNVPDSCRFTEIKRFSRFDAERKVRYDIDSVQVCFSGNILPSHISLDSVNYPVSPYRERVLQCRKCWHFGHTDRVCSRGQKLCKTCGAAHDEVEFSLSPKCVNCIVHLHLIVQFLKN